MSTEFNYVVNVDQSRVMSSASELSSTMQMALSRGMQGAQLQSGMGSAMSDVGGGVSGLGQMANAMMRGPGMVPGFAPMVGGTFTNQAMAYTPHWGMQQAETSLQQEWLVDRYGLGAAAKMRPPGVGALEYGQAVERNFIERKAEAERQAFSAARTSVVAGGAGLMAGEGGGLVGALVGGAIGARFGAPGLGKIIGGLGGLMTGQNIAESTVTQHYAEVEQSRGIITELGEIAGAGRNISREGRIHMGAGAMAAAKDVGIDVQQMGDILAGARQLGMAPSSSDPQKFREQARDLAAAVTEWAEALHTSGSKAMSMIRGMTSMNGGSATQALDSLIGMGAASGLGAEAMYGIGMAGAGVARQNQLPGRIGFDLFTSGVMRASGSSASREEQSMMGGVSGIGQMLAMHEISSAKSPMGQVQLMAGLTGRGLESSPYGLASQAIEGMSAGGNFLDNYMNFAVNEDKMQATGGARGIRARAKQQLMSSIESLRDMGATGDDQTIGAFSFVNQGYSPVRARELARQMLHTGGGGGDGGAAEAAVLEARQKRFLNEQAIAMGATVQQPSALRAAAGAIGDVVQESQWGRAMTFAGAGSVAGLALGPGALLGGLAGGIGGYLSYKDPASGTGVTQFALGGTSQSGYEEGLEDARKVQGRLDAAAEKFGSVKFNAGDAGDRRWLQRIKGADFSGSAFDLDESNPQFAKTMSGVLTAMGVESSDRGSLGTMASGGRHYKITDVLGRFNQKAKHTPESRAEFEAVRGSDEFDASKSAQLKERFDQLPRRVHEEGFSSATLDMARQVLPARLKSQPMGPEARAYIESYVNAGRMGEGDHWHIKSLPVEDLAKLAVLDGSRSAENKQEARYRRLIGDYATGDRAQSWDDLGSQLGPVASQRTGWFDQSSDAKRRLAETGFKDDHFKTALRRDREAILRDQKESTPESKQALQAVRKESLSILSKYEKDFGGVKAVDVVDSIHQRMAGDLKKASEMSPADRYDAGRRGKLDTNEMMGFLEQREKTGATKHHAGAAKKPEQAGSAENAVGFGMQESAMSNIARSIKSLVNSTSMLEKRIAGTKLPATPPGAGK